MPATFDPTAAMVEAAARLGVHVIFGTIEPIDEQAATAYNLICMAYPDGRPPARYRRTHPNGPWIYTGGTAWEFQYVPATSFRCSTRCMARSDLRCAARSTCRKSRARWRCAAPS
jgi:predicted amidohydrolase